MQKHPSLTTQDYIITDPSSSTFTPIHVTACGEKNALRKAKLTGYRLVSVSHNPRRPTLLEVTRV